MPAPEPAEYSCTVCNTPFLNAFPLDEQSVCAACRAGLRAFDRAASFGAYEGTLRSLIHLLKYKGMKPLARPLAELMNRALAVDAAFDAIVPVPLYWRRQWGRGFNQAELLARHVGKQRGLSVINALRRRRATDTQASLATTGRRKNVAGAFTVRRNADVAGKRILLIDDVMTTGATAGACASVLKKAGAKSISLLTVARVDRRSKF